MNRMGLANQLYTNYTQSFIKQVNYRDPSSYTNYTQRFIKHVNYRDPSRAKVINVLQISYTNYTQRFIKHVNYSDPSRAKVINVDEEKREKNSEILKN